MKITQFATLVALGSLLLAGAGCKKSGGSSSAASLDGKWVGSEVDNPAAQEQITINNGTFEFHGTNENDTFSGTISILYEEQQPGSLDVTITEPESLAGKTALFSIEHKGNELKMAWFPPGSTLRPQDLNPAPGVRVASFKRQ